MNTRTDDISASMDRLTLAIDSCLQDLKETCGDRKELYLQSALSVISGFYNDIQDDLGFTGMEQFGSHSHFSPDANYEEGDEWGEDDWNDFEEEDDAEDDED